LSHVKLFLTTLIVLILFPFCFFITSALSWSDGGDSVPPRELTAEYENQPPQKGITPVAEVKTSPKAGEPMFYGLGSCVVSVVVILTLLRAYKD
jgi:hypothetical protein